ncbi:phosphate/phosphite/phosphonate ABC transporter substrate-binding protein [Solidesulfovibrio fructosivorans]|nr:phosphate/phosphite/phosphonate ABC transporter substrate-binding protein [Solidesulfovibrio fructosivorans]
MPFAGLLALLILLSCRGGAALADAAGLGFGIIATSASQTLLDAWRPLLADLSAFLGESVSPRIYDDYAGVIWAMAAGRVQVAWLGNKSAIEAVDRAGGEVALRSVDPAGRTEYYSHLLVRRDSGLADVETVFARAGRLTFGDGDPNSTSGHAVPAYYLFASRGISPRAVFKRVVSGNHEENFLGVGTGRLDVATGNSVDLARQRQRYPGFARDVVTIWTSPPIPSDPIVWRADLPAGLKDRIRAFFLGYGRAAPDKPATRLAHERKILAALSRSGFEASDNSQLTPVRIIELYREKLRLASTSGPDREMRRKRLETIEEQLRRLLAMQANM